MAKESKSDRLARMMFDQVSEYLHELCAIRENPNSKEQDVERWVQSVVRSCLGFSASNGYVIRSQEAKGRMRPDLLVLKGEAPILVIEVKKLDFDLDKADFRSGKSQLKEYLSSLSGVSWGILCNGYEWRLYDFANQTQGGVLVYSFDLRSDNDQIDLAKRAIEEVCWNFVEIHESQMSSGNWKDLSKEATAFSPESLARAMLSGDIVRSVAKNIRGEHDLKANIDVLFDKVSDLLERGLDDSITDWNEAKKADFHRYIKAQKKSLRRKKKLSTKSDVVQTVDAQSPSNPDSSPQGDQSADHEVTKKIAS